MIKTEEVASNEVNKLILDEIIADNKEFKIQNILFSAEYSRFVNQIIDNLEEYDPSMQKQALKYAIITYLTITVREKSDSEIYNKLKRIQAQIQHHP